MESALPALNKQIATSQRELLAVLEASRAKAKAEVRRRMALLSRSGNVRERALGGVLGHYQTLAKELDAWIGDLARRTGEMFWVRAGLDSGKGKGIVEYRRDHAEAVFRMVRPENMSSLAAVQAGKMAGQDVQAVRSSVMSAMRRGAIEGMTRPQIEREVRTNVTALLEEKGLPSFSFVSSNGARWKPGNYFNMLTRTVTSRIARETYVDRLTKEGFDLASIEGGGNPCPVCASWRGVIVSLSGSNEDFPSLNDAEEAGVFHPNCCCSPAYVDETVDAKTIEDQQAAFEDMKDFPPEPDPEDWTNYANTVQSKEAAREYVEPTYKTEAMQPDEDLDEELAAAREEASQ